MGNLKILHLSDVHWSPESDRDIKIVVDALIKDLNRFKSEGMHPNFVVFSGDLVWSGADVKHFQRGFDAVLEPVMKTFGLSSEKVFICPGNHDIDRSKVVDFVESGLVSSLGTSGSVNTFIDSLNAGETAQKIAVDRLKNFNLFMRTMIKKPPNVLNSLLVQCFRFDVEGESIGISIFNTAWRCTGAPNDADRNLLLIGERSIDNALKPLEGCDLKIAVFHHPTEWLSDADQAVVLSRLYSEFDLLMHGHIHKSLPEQRFTTSGTALLSQAGCLYNSRNFPNSYQMIEIDTDQLEALFRIRTFFDSPRREFDAALNVNAGGMFKCEFFGRKKNIRNNDIRRQLRPVSLQIRAKEAAHLDIGGVFHAASKDARTTFVCPPLTLRKFAVDINEDSKEKKKYEDREVSLEEILRYPSNIAFSSQKEGGKTSLANHIAALISEGLSDVDRIPIVISFSAIRKGRHGLINGFYAYYGATGRKMDGGQLLENGSLAIIIDDVVLKDPGDENELLGFVSLYPGNRFICMIDSSHLVGDPTREALSSCYRQVFIKALPRRSIREISKRWGQLTGLDDIETNTFIVKQVQENNLPRTGYIISLLIWAYQKQKKLERINEAFLLSAIIDSLLDKADFTKALRREFDPVAAEITLQEIAVYLRDQDGVAPVNEMLEHLINFFRRKALDLNAMEVLQKLTECGVLTQNEIDVQFKYKCFQEYFIALHLRSEPAICKHIVLNSAKHYRRELYLLSGLRRKNFELLQWMRDRLNTLIPERLEEISSADFSQISMQNIFDPSTKMKLTAVKTRKVTTEQVDDFLDATERELDKRGISEREDEKKRSVVGMSDNEPLAIQEAKSITDYIDEVSLYGLIVKNSEFDEGLVKEEALRFYLEMMTRFIVYATNLMKEVVDSSFDKIFVKPLGPAAHRLSEIDREAIKAKLYLSMQKLLVSILTSKISDEIATEKLKVTYNKIIDDDASRAEARLFIGLLLYDLNLGGWEKRLTGAIELNSTPFMIDTVADRLWYDLYTRYENETRRSKIAVVVDHLERKVGKQPERDRNRQAIERAAILTQARGKV